MNILRLSTLSLTLAIAVFALGYVDSASAAPKPCVEDDPRGRCNPPDDGAIEYTVELLGAFVFAVPVPPLDVVLESRDLTLRSSDHVTIVRPASSGPLQDTWDNVFDFCNGLLTETDNVRVNEFTALAGKKGWTIDRPGGVQIRFRNIGTFDSFLGELDLRLDLIGDCDYSGGNTPCDPFPPDPETTSSIPLTQYLIHARGQPGINSVCHGERADFFKDNDPILVITALCPDGSIPPCTD